MAFEAAVVEKPSLWGNALALGLVAVAGGLCLAMPFLSDQALLTLYARQLARGAVLYRDLFDIKQPGIFLFYTIGGLLFGFTEVGIHLFELFYWLTFSLFAMICLSPYFATRWGGPLVPVLTVVFYYLYAQLADLTQIEILVAFPILVAWWLIEEARPGTHTGLRRYAAAGLVTATVVLLKHLYFLIVLVFVAYAVLRCRRRGTPLTDVRRSLVVFVIALLVPLLAVASYFAAYGQLERIWWIYFEFVLNSQLTGTKALTDLEFGVRRFMIGHAPILILAVLGCIRGLRHGTRPTADLVTGMFLWGTSGAVALSLQGWWDYKWVLFTVPFGIVAVVGTEAFVTTLESFGTRMGLWISSVGAALGILSSIVGARSPHMQTWLLLSVVIGAVAAVAAELLPGWSDRRWAVHVLAASLAVSVGLMAIGPIDKFRMLRSHHFALTIEDGAEFRRSSSTAYRAADEDLQVLRSGQVLPGPLHVFGDPVLLFRANRRPAIPFLGQDPHSWDSRAWREMDRDLRSAMPPYIIIDTYSEVIIRNRNAAIMQMIESRYKVAFVGATGTWYVLR